MMFHSSWEAISAFCGCPSFNFDGPVAVRRHLRRLRKNGVGETLFIGTVCSAVIRYDRSSFRIKTSKSPFIDYYGDPAKRRWVCRTKDIVVLVQGMPFRCPRCWSDKRPKQWSLREDDAHFHRYRAEDLDGAVLCDNCRDMNELRETRKACRAVQEIADVQREMKYLLRQRS